MIRLSETKILEDYFIDENGVITDINGIVQKPYLHQGRPKFKGVAVHRILMYTFYGYRDTKIWDIHHIDGNKLNNSLSNLVYLTRSEHSSLHHKGKVLSEETKRQISINHSNISGKNNPMYGKTHSKESRNKISLKNKGRHWNLSEETKKKMSLAKRNISEITKEKISLKIKGRIWINNGVENKMVYPDRIPIGFTKGMIKR